MSGVAPQSGYLIQTTAGQAVVYPVTFGAPEVPPEPEPYVPPDFDRMRAIADALGGDDGALLHAMVELWEDER